MARKPSTEAASELIGVFDWERVGVEEYRPVLRIEEPWARVTPDLPERLYLGLSCDVLNRLIQAGFVDARPAAGGRTEMNLHSWFAHVEASSAPGFWDPGSPAWRRWRASKKPARNALATRAA